MLKKISLYITLVLGVMVLFSSCKKEYETIQSIDDAKIQAYLKQQNLTMDPHSSGYYYKVVDPGSGAIVKNSDSVYYYYSFSSLTGQQYTKTSELAIAGNYLGYTDQFVIGGAGYSLTPFREVLSLLKRGGNATLILPSYLAFGKNGISTVGIPPNEVMLVNIGTYTQSKRHEIDDLMINTFKTTNNLTLTKDPSGAYYNVITPGTGTDVINTTSTIRANYTVRYLNGTQLEASNDGTFTAVLEDLYVGWQKIIPGKVTKGGKIRLVLPSALGGGGTPLDFDIEIVEVTN